MRIKNSARALAFVIPCLAAVSIFAQTNVDQSQPVDSGLAAPFSTPGLGQTFQQSGDNINGGAFKLEANVGVGTGTITISLWSDVPSSSSATELASGSATGSPGQWVSVYWAPVPSTPGLTYFLGVSSSNSGFGLAGAGNVYPNGEGYANNYTPFSFLDYTFQTYTQVPEPNTGILIGLGLAGFLVVARWRGRR
jgi:hypothetical protein